MNSLIIEFTKKNIDSRKSITNYIILLFIDFLISFIYIGNATKISSFLIFFTIPFYIIGYIILTLVNTYNIYDDFSNNPNYILRFKDKKDYFYNLLKIIVFNNFIFFIISIIISIIFINIFSHGVETINIPYNIPLIIYTIFYCVRFYIIVQLLVIITLLIVEITNKIFGIIFNIINWMIIFFHPYDFEKQVSSIFDMGFLIDYYFRIHSYSSFELEVLCSIIFITLLVIIISILYGIILKKVGE